MKILEDKKYDVEHMLSLYALSFVTTPAAGIYDKERLSIFSDLLKKCHIYVIGSVPRVDLKHIRLEGVDLTTTFEVLGKQYDLVWVLDEGVELIEQNGAWFLRKDGKLANPPSELNRPRFAGGHLV